MNPEIEIYFDGSIGPKNPGGTAAYGFVAYDKDRNKIGYGYGRVGTGPQYSNNVAEFCGLSHGMKWAISNHPEKAVLFKGDSQLVIELMRGASRAKKGLYLPYYHEAIALATPYIMKGQWSFEWIPRSLNSEADDLSQYERYKERK